jgi:hypothetical protein
MKKGLVVNYDEFLGDVIEYLDSCGGKGKGFYKLEVMLKSLYSNTGVKKNLGSLFFDIVELEYKNIEVFEVLYLDICKEGSYYECLNGESLLDKRSGLLYENGLYFRLTKLG